MFSETTDRVPEHTNPDINEQIECDTEQNIECMLCVDAQRISERIEELDREWDIERVLEFNAAAIASSGILMALCGKKSRLILPLVVTGFLLQHAIQGWCPPLAVFRRLGYRTAKEIENERHALKMLRGDYETQVDAALPKRVQVRQLLNAVEK